MMSLEISVRLGINEVKMCLGINGVKMWDVYRVSRKGVCSYSAVTSAASQNLNYKVYYLGHIS